MKAFTRTLKTAMPTMLLFASLSGVTTMSYADSTNPNAPVSMTDKWDKTFAESQKVDHRKVSFPNRYGITLVGDLYLPKDRGDRKLAAIAVSGPFGAVKEQSQRLVCADAGGTRVCYPGVRSFLHRGKRRLSAKRRLTGYQH